MTETEMKWFRLGKLLRRNLMAAKGEQWETVYEGELTTVARESGPSYPLAYFLRSETYVNVLAIGATYRLTVDGVSTEFVCEEIYNGKFCGCIGNPHIARNGYTDRGYDYAVDEQEWFYEELKYGMAFKSRNPGTYTVKIERKLKE